MEQATEQAVAEKSVKKGGRPAGSKNKEKPKYAIVVWGYTQNQFKEDYDVEKDEVVRVKVEDYEAKTYKERVPLEQVVADNCFSWELGRNERLERNNRPNRIRVINWYPEEVQESDALDTVDAIKTAIRDAGVTHG